MLLAHRGFVVGQEMPVEKNLLDSQQTMDFPEEEEEEEEEEGNEMRINDALDHKGVRFNPPVNGEESTIARETSHESSIHSDYIHQLKEETIENKTNMHGSYPPLPLQHAGDWSSEQRACTEETKSTKEDDAGVPTFTIEQLRTLLQTLEDGEKVDTVSVHHHRSWKSSDLVDDEPNEDQLKVMLEDDRTLLDIFGEAAKQFLTQKVVRNKSFTKCDLSMVLIISTTTKIPETNPECKWDWRSLNCEPICECEFHLKLGDYHLGRSCRVRTLKPPGICQSVDPAFLVEQTTLTQRIGWMLRRTWIGIRRRYGKGLKSGIQGLKEQSLVQLNELQQKVCAELWDLLYSQEQTKRCWYMTDVPSVSLTQRLLCGPIHFNLCDDFVADVHVQPSARVEYA
jgi:hypothetical protein